MRSSTKKIETRFDYDESGNCTDAFIEEYLEDKPELVVKSNISMYYDGQNRLIEVTSDGKPLGKISYDDGFRDLVTIETEEDITKTIRRQGNIVFRKKINKKDNSVEEIHNSYRYKNILTSSYESESGIRTMYTFEAVNDKNALEFVKDDPAFPTGYYQVNGQDGSMQTGLFPSKNHIHTLRLDILRSNKARNEFMSNVYDRNLYDIQECIDKHFSLDHIMAYSEIETIYILTDKIFTLDGSRNVCKVEETADICFEIGSAALYFRYYEKVKEIFHNKYMWNIDVNESLLYPHYECIRSIRGQDYEVIISNNRTIHYKYNNSIGPEPIYAKVIDVVGNSLVITEYIFVYELMFDDGRNGQRLIKSMITKTIKDMTIREEGLTWLDIQ